MHKFLVTIYFVVVVVFDLDTEDENQKLFSESKTYTYKHTMKLEKENQFSPKHCALKGEISNDPGKK